MDGPQPQICREQIWTHKVRPEGNLPGADLDAQSAPGGCGTGMCRINQPPTRGFSVASWFA